MDKQPLLICCLFFVAGILVFDYFHFSDRLVCVLLCVSVLLLTIVFLKNIYLQKIKSISLWFFFFSLGLYSHSHQKTILVLPEITGKQTAIFQLNKKLNSNTKYRRYEVRVLKISGTKVEPFNLVLSIPKEKHQLNFKDYYRCDLYLNKVQSPNNDFQFDYSKFLSRKSIFFQSFAIDEIYSASKTTLSFSDQIRQSRLDILSRIDRSSLQPTSREFLKGIILADRTEMDETTVSDFSKSGLVHLLAISGSHMVILFWLLMLVFRPVFALKFRNMSIVLALIIIWCFAIFIDYGSSVMRSCIMITAYYSFIILQRKPDLLHALALAAFVLLIFDTNQIFDVGFQLSFVAVLGIYWLNNPILNYLPTPRNDFQKFLMTIPSVSLSAQIATLPLVLYYFHQYSFVSFVANLLIIPFSEIIIISSLFMTILFAFGLDFSVISTIYDWMIRILLEAIHWLASWDFIFFKSIPMTVLEVAVLFVLAFLLRFVLLRNGLKSVLRFCFVLLLFFALRIGFDVYFQQKDEVLLVENFKNKTLIIKQNRKAHFYFSEDVKQESIQKLIIEPYLSSRRIKNYQIIKIPNDVAKIEVKGKIYNLK